MENFPFNLSNLIINYKIKYINIKKYSYSTLISFPLGFVCFFLLNITSRIPLLYVDVAVSISVSVGNSITL